MIDQVGRWSADWLVYTVWFFLGFQIWYLITIRTALEAIEKTLNHGTLKVSSHD